MSVKCWDGFSVSYVCASWITTCNTHFSMWSTSTNIFIFISHILYIHIPNPLVPKNTLLYLNTKHRSRGQCNSSWSGATYAYSSSSCIAFSLLYWVLYWLTSNPSHCRKYGGKWTAPFTKSITKWAMIFLHVFLEGNRGKSWICWYRTNIQHQNIDNPTQTRVRLSIQSLPVMFIKFLLQDGHNMK